MNPNSERPAIPLPILREVRQRCGFGCVICGIPFYQYDHILGWAKTERHIAEELTLLCLQHHGEKTSGLLPNEVVIEANKNPYNLRQGVSKPYNLHYSGSECETRIGSVVFTTKDEGYGTEIIPLSIDDIPIIGFIMSNGHLLLTLNLFDHFNNFILRIINNQLVYSVSPWDIEFIGRNLIIRGKKRNIFIDIKFEVPNKIIISRGRFILNGVEVLIHPDFVHVVNGIKTSHMRVENFHGGLILGRNEKQVRGAVSVPKIPRGYLKEIGGTPEVSNLSIITS
jgi:trigger factor